MGPDLFADQATSGLTVIKCLSLWEPWATLMALGHKRVETRSWYTSHRGPLLICASKRRNVRELAELFSKGRQEAGKDSPFTLALRRPEDRVVADIVNRLAFGMAVAVVDLVDCCPTAALEDVDEPERSFGDYSRGRYAWITDDLRPIK